MSQAALLEGVNDDTKKHSGKEITFELTAYFPRFACHH